MINLRTHYPTYSEPLRIMPKKGMVFKHLLLKKYNPLSNP